MSRKDNSVRPGKPPVALLHDMDIFARELIKIAQAKAADAPPVTIAEKTAIFGNVAKWIGIRFGGKLSDDDAWEGQGLIDDLRDRLQGKDSIRAQRERRIDSALSRASGSEQLTEFKRKFLPADAGDDAGDRDGDLGPSNADAGNSRGLRTGMAGDG